MPLLYDVHLAVIAACRLVVWLVLTACATCSHATVVVLMMVVIRFTAMTCVTLYEIAALIKRYLLV